MAAAFLVFFSCFVAFGASYRTAPPSPSCDENEIYSTCVNGYCGYKNCSELGGPAFCIDPIKCQGGCTCKSGYLRLDDTGKCVPEASCSTPGFQQCGQNEIISCVQDCPPETTCRTRGIQFSCQQSDKGCQKKCVCIPGHYRNAIGQCIAENECDLCQKPNEFFSCGPECDNECSTLTTQNRTNCPIINIQCNPKCYCEDGFARDDQNECVPIEKCSKSEFCEGPNEEYVSCKATCPPEVCFSISAFYDCSDEPPCEPGCACQPGFLRKQWNSTCVPLCECPQMYNSSECEKEREKLKMNHTDEK